MSKKETDFNLYEAEISMPLDENTDFNLVVWANSLLGTGNSNYQNEFYARQARKIQDRYNRTWRSN